MLPRILPPPPPPHTRASAAGVFACFSAAALLSPRRSYLFLGGLLASVMTTFFWMRFASWMFGSGGAMLYQVGGWVECSAAHTFVM